MSAEKDVMQNMLPTKLSKEPLIDAVFEARFTSQAPLSSILPGILFSLGTGISIEQTPAAALPKQIRDSDPNLRFAPVIKMEWGNFFVLLSDQSVAVACKLPYPGWTSFKTAITRVLELTGSLPLIEQVERYSLKYVDIIESSEIGDQASFVNLKVNLGNQTLEREAFQVRIEVPQGSLINAVQLVSSATATIPDGTIKNGLIIDIDTIQNTNGLVFSELLNGFSDRLDDMHKANKTMFFECLAPATLTSLGPRYD